jgi:hypothetical protein
MKLRLLDMEIDFLWASILGSFDGFSENKTFAIFKIF